MSFLRRSLVALGAVMLGAMAPPLAAQGGVIRGTVTNSASSAPIQGAQVFIVGTRFGAMTGADGRYTITGVPGGAQTVRLRALGFQPLDRAVTVGNAELTVDFAATTAPVSLDEVVVTGTAGSARKREVGNSIGQVKVADAPEVSTNVSQLLTGKLAGVQVSGGVGNAGGGSAIRLRGSTSVALTNQPLIYIDGVRTRSDEYPRNGVFTGATQRGANSNSSPLNDINPDDIDRIEVVKGAAAATLFGTDAAAGVIQIFTKRGAAGAARWQTQFNTGFNDLQKFGTDSVPYLWMDQFVRKGVRMGGNAQVNGGTDAIRYLVSFGGDQTEGVLPNDIDRKYQLRTNVDFQPFKNIAVNWNSAYTNNLLNQTPAGNNAQGLTLNVFRQDRNYFGNANPDTIAKVLTQSLKSNIDRLILGNTTTWTPFTRFSSRFTIGFDRAALENRNVRPYGFPNAPLGIIQNQRWGNTTLSTDWVNNYDFDLGSSLKVTASAGTQYVNSLVADVIGLGENFPAPGDPSVALGAIRNSDENRQRVVTGGAFGQTLFGFKDRFFLTLGARLDGNSAFGSDFGFQLYPKASGSWVISEESFWKPSLGTLKLRTAYGAAGRAPGAFDAVRTYQGVGWGPSPAVRPLNLGNSELGPERTTELELGFDHSALDGRFSLDFTWYRARTTDALFNVTSIPSQGFLGSVLKNVGELEKSGIEAVLSGTVIDRPMLGLTLGLNVTTNQSKVVSLGGIPSFAVGGDGWVVEGQPAPVVQGKLIRNADAVGAAPDTVSRHNFGPSNPTRIIGGSINLRTWKNISILARGEYQGGAYISEGASFNALSRSVLWPTCFDAYPKLTAGQPVTVREQLTCVRANVRSDMFVFPADFFKLRDVTVTVPLGRLIPRTASSSLVFTAQNFFRRNYGLPLFDPEMSDNGGFNVAVRAINEQIPAPAVFLSSLRISF